MGKSVRLARLSRLLRNILRMTLLTGSERYEWHNACAIVLEGVSIWLSPRRERLLWRGLA
jgi:hypothetical protein